jgi:hypothetical protein
VGQWERRRETLRGGEGKGIVCFRLEGIVMRECYFWIDGNCFYAWRRDVADYGVSSACFSSCKSP